MTDAQDKLDRHYQDFESGWDVVDRAATYKTLVTSADNASKPFHRWFHLKEAFAHNLLSQLRSDEGRKAAKGWSTVLDPFSGGGTTVLSALSEGGTTVAGVERNPALRVIADAKLAGYCLPRAQLPALIQAAGDLDFGPARRRATESVTLNNPRYFDQFHVSGLLSIREQLREVSDERLRRILEGVLLSTVEAVGRVRRDGRALRFDPGKTVLEPEQAFSNRLALVLEDIENRGSDVGSGSKVKILDGDARNVDQVVAPMDSSYERIVFSPPYPNNIDYTEVYKMENWVLGHWAHASDMRDQRLRTLRSHPSVLFPEEYHYESSSVAMEFGALIDPLIDGVPEDRYARGRKQLIQGYVDDMWAVLIACRRMVAAGGRLYCVVGNSVHGSALSNFVVAADILIARAGELAGWKVSEIRVARGLTRRTSRSPYVRESIVVLEPT